MYGPKVGAEMCLTKGYCGEVAWWLRGRTHIVSANYMCYGVQEP